MRVKSTRTRPLLLMIGVRRPVLDNVRVLLGTMGCRCVIGASIQEALALLEKEKPEAAVIDMQVLASPSAETLVLLHKVVLRLRGRVVVLPSEGWNLQLPVLDAYGLPKIPVNLLFQELVPCLELLLRGTIAPGQKVNSARLVFDSSLQPLPVGVRSAPATDHRLLYESGDVMVDLWLEPNRDSSRITLVGQILHEVKSGPLFYCAPVVLQSQAEPIEATATNELGEFHLDFNPHPDLRLEIGVRENQWVSVELPDSSNAARETQ